jgi:lysophospholipase L1-like esterase
MLLRPPDRLVSRQRRALEAVPTGAPRIDAQTVAPPVSSGRLRLARAVAVLLGVLTPLLLLEVALRFFGPILPGNYDTGHYLERHPRLGHFNVPGFDGWIKTSEFTTRVTISPLGLRDPRTEYARPADTHRILVLGDSFVEAVQVDASKTVAARLEASLQQHSSRPVEVINAGVAGYGTGQEMLLLDQEGVRYQPNVIVLVVFLGNDIGDNSYRPDPARSEQTTRPTFELDSERMIRVEPGARSETGTGFRQALRSCCLLYNVFETGVLMKLSHGPVRDQPEFELDGRYLVRSLYETKPDPEMSRAWRITERLLGMMRDRASSEGVPFVIVGASDWLALDETAWQERLGESRAASGRYAPDVPNRMLGEIAGRLGVPYLDLLPTLASTSSREPLYFPIDTHWTPAGHAVVAEAIEAKLREHALDGR